ncbi:MAG TPA: cache domain-containing protein, partial [Burkholderiales bacterium]|nr:cache domain-containing protein [Burkholderiales bacterium]
MKRHEQSISLIGFLILMILTLATGISVYMVMLHQTESLLSKSLATSLKNNAYLVESQIEQGVEDTRMISTRPFIIDSLKRIESDNEDPKSRVDLQRIAQSFLSHGFRGVSFYDREDHALASAGRFSHGPGFQASLDSKRRLFLIWDGQFILHAKIEVLDNAGSRIGAVMTEVELPPLNNAFANLASIGKTGEFAICAPLGNDPGKMDCLLNRISGKEFQRVNRVIEDNALPMNYALEGRAGIILAKDYRRRNVVAAYSPVGKLGLGMVLKIDQSELYSPITEQLTYIAILIAFLVILGGLLLY